MSVSRKIGVLITKSIFYYDSLHLPNFSFRLNLNPMPFSTTKNGLSIPNIWQKKGFLSFPLKIIFALKLVVGGFLINGATASSFRRNPKAFLAELLARVGPKGPTF